MYLGPAPTRPQVLSPYYKPSSKRVLRQTPSNPTTSKMIPDPGGLLALDSCTKPIALKMPVIGLDCSVLTPGQRDPPPPSAPNSPLPNTATRSEAVVRGP